MKTRTLLALLLIPSLCFAEPVLYRKKNTATRVCGTIFNATTAKSIGAAVTGIACKYAQVLDGTDESAFTDVSGTETVVGTAGQFCTPISATEINIDGDLRIHCTATNTDAADWAMLLTTRNTVTGSTLFDGQTLGEATGTIDLKASAISADDQFNGYRLDLYDSNGNPLASSCITDSTNANERVTLETDLSSIHTIGDNYNLVPDAVCSKRTTIDAINAKTTNLPADPASQGDVETYIDGNCSGGGSGGNKGQN